jgi:hypothetical protein
VPASDPDAAFDEGAQGLQIENVEIYQSGNVGNITVKILNPASNSLTVSSIGLSYDGCGGSVDVNDVVPAKSTVTVSAPLPFSPRSPELQMQALVEWSEHNNGEGGCPYVNCTLTVDTAEGFTTTLSNVFVL